MYIIMIHMRAKIIILCVLIMCSQYSFADEVPFKVFFHWNIGDINTELNIYQEEYSFIFSARLLNYYIDFNRIIFFEISPFKYWFFSEDKIHKITFFNFSIFFNIIDVKTYFRPYLFGPIASINWLENDNFNKFTSENYIYSIGIKFTIFPPFGLSGGRFWYPDKMCYLIDFESGYRNINGKHNIYMGVRVTPEGLALGALMFILW